MLLHYLKVAVRNLLKYKTQSVISILGLAIGLATFTLSAFWVRYEMTFDTFHRDAERIYLVATDNDLFGDKLSHQVPPALGNYLKSNYSEIEATAKLLNYSNTIEHDGGLKDIYIGVADSSALEMFDIRLLKGNDNFCRLTLDECMECAISEKTAMKLFGTLEVIGKKIKIPNNAEFTISAIISSWKEGHSNFPYDVLIPGRRAKDLWTPNWETCFIKVKEGTDVEALSAAMNKNFPKEMKESMYGPTGLTCFYLKPITKLRLDESFVGALEEKVVKSKYIIYFSLTGLLIILCALVNYLTVYTDHLRTRSREMALRKVCGASEWSLLKLFATEQLLVVLLSGMLGMVLIEILLPFFLKYSQIMETRDMLYGNCILITGIMSLVILGITLISIAIIRKTSLHRSLSNRNNNFARKCSIVVQLFVCLSFIISTTLMQMQIYHLRNVDTGFDFQNKGAVSLWMNVDMNVWYDKIKQLPMVEEVVTPKYNPMIGQGAMTYFNVNQWDGLDKPLEKSIVLENILAGEEFFRFYNIQLIAGKWIDEKSKENEGVITESTARRMGWTPEEAIGKHFKGAHPGSPSHNVIGVVKDCAYRSPSADVPYSMFVNTYHEYNQYFWGRAFVLFKYKAGTWEECKKHIEEMHQTEAPDKKLFLYNETEEYNKFLKSENALSALLSFASLVCIFICVFGIYSLITLTCEHRRKEIAIRKVNGAKLGNILGKFVKEYTGMLLIASMIAFPISYVIMKQWIQTYNRQVEIGILPFAIIFIGIALVITISIGHRVWKAANENPADVVKSE